MVDDLPWPQLDPFPPGWLGDTPPEAVSVWRRLTPVRRLGVRAQWDEVVGAG